MITNSSKIINEKTKRLTRLAANLLLLLLLGYHTSYAQEKKITGKVISDAGIPLTSVSIQVKGKAGGTTTLDNGTYAITVPESATLVFSYVGFVKQEIDVKTKQPSTW